MSQEAYEEFEKIRTSMLVSTSSTEVLKKTADELEAMGKPKDDWVLVTIKRELYKRKIPKMEPMVHPAEVKIIVIKDYDGYFERMVRSWVQDLASRGKKCRNPVIKIDAGPYRPDAFSCSIDEQDAMVFSFYSAIRSGFGSLTREDELKIIDNWV